MKFNSCCEKEQIVMGKFAKHRFCSDVDLSVCSMVEERML
jgi:hypothetical protein